MYSNTVTFDPESDYEPPSATFTSVCHTPGCVSQNIPIDVELPETTKIFICGGCGGTPDITRA